MYEQTLEFTFEAAHTLADPATPSHPYGRVHGHSFCARATLASATLSDEGWVMDFARLREVCAGVAAQLDHRLLNDIEGLERPTLESLAAWIFDAIAADAPALTRIELARPSLGERVSYAPALNRQD